MASATNEHVFRISSVLDGRSASTGSDLVSRSWRRSLDTFRVDPASRESPHVLTSFQLSALRQQSETLIEAARPEIDRLYRIVRPARYAVLLTDPDGIVIDHRGANEEAEEFKRWGLWLGRVWSESVEGTNGIGTALVDGCPTTIHRVDHFRERHIGLSCSGAPIFDEGGRLVGLVDVSTFDSNASDHSHILTGALTIAAACGIGERLFRAKSQGDWVIAAARTDRPGVGILLAVNDSHRIVGANRDARTMLAKLGLSLADNPSIWALFERNDAVFRRRDSGDISCALTNSGSGETWPVIITPPLPAFVAKFMLDVGSVHWRPRIDTLLSGTQPAPPDDRLSITPAALRRVRDYVNARLDGDLSVKALADAAGLSASHFARAFKKSESMTPSAFVLRQRIAKARSLLLGSNLSLSEIALAVGFADQSHFARRFRQQTGLSPGQFRKLQH